MAQARLNGNGRWEGRHDPFRETMVRWTLAYWAGVYVLFTLRSFVLPYDMLVQQAGLRMVMMGVGLSFCAVLFRLLDRIDPRPGRLHLPLLAAAAAVATGLYLLVNYLVFYVLPGLWQQDRSTAAILGRYAVELFWLFAAWIGLYLLARRRHAAPAEPACGAADALWIRDRGSAVRVLIATIRWIEAEGDYVRVHAGQRSHLMRATMRTMEEKLDPAGFVRIHRGAIAAAGRIVAVERRNDGRIEVRLDSGETLPAGRRFLPRLKDLDRVA